MATAGKLTELSPVSDDGNDIIAGTAPRIVSFRLTGSCPILFHRWSVESVAEKAAAAKGSAAKKSDDVESYVWRNSDKEICIPGEYVRQTMISAAKFRQDPRSPRASMKELMKAAIAPMTDLAPINGGVEDWEYLDQRRVMVQRNGVTRSRPAFGEGWWADFTFQIILPHYVSPRVFQEILTDGGRVIGLADFRPTYGRYLVQRFEDVTDVYSG